MMTTTLTGRTHDGLSLTETFDSFEAALSAAMELATATVTRDRHVVTFAEGRVLRNRRLSVSATLADTSPALTPVTGALAT